jgi:regulator of protease activity HflC (stomatin/prohibitin superfamily)
MTSVVVIGTAVAASLIVLLAMSIRVVPEYERGVIFRLGRILGVGGPGLFFLIPVVDRMVRVSLRTTTNGDPPSGRHHLGQRHGHGERRRVLQRG